MHLEADFRHDVRIGPSGSSVTWLFPREPWQLFFPLTFFYLLSFLLGESLFTSLENPLCGGY